MGKEQENVSARRGSMCKGMMQHDPLKNQRSLGARRTQPEMQLNSPAKLELAMLHTLGFSPALKRAALPNHNSWQAASSLTATPGNLDLVLPQFPPSAKHKMIDSPCP